MKQPESIEIGHHRVSDGNFTTLWRAKEPALVVISIPHDVIPNFAWADQPREYGVRGGDKNVWLIAKDILFGNDNLVIPKFASVVKGNVPRGMVDYNRAWPEGINYYPNSKERPETALDNPQYAFAYQYYHDWIAALLEESIHHYGQKRCLLIDLHGFSKQPPYAPEQGYDLILGTGNRQTILHENIDQQLGEFMRVRGYQVFVPREESVVAGQEDRYNAGFTTHHYSERYRINAVQIETEMRFRRLEKGSEVGPKLSQDLALFLEEYYFGQGGLVHKPSS